MKEMKKSFLALQKEMKSSFSALQKEIAEGKSK